MIPFAFFISISCSLGGNASFGFTYSTAQQKIITFPPGSYLLEANGGDGGSSRNSMGGGKGAHFRGKFDIDQEQTRTIAFFPGQHGATPKSDSTTDGGANGKNTGIGGKGGRHQEALRAGASGGAASLMCIGDERYLVVAGGSGGTYWHHGAPGGNTTTIFGRKNSDEFTTRTVDPNECSDSSNNGDGKNGVEEKNDNIAGSGGGGGYCGGDGGNESNNYVGEGGLSFVKDGFFQEAEFMINENPEFIAKDGDFTITVLFECTEIGCSECTGTVNENDLTVSSIKCIKCNIGYELKDGKCEFIPPTKSYVFSDSEGFSVSIQFSSSISFSQSISFTDSSDFSTSISFTDSSDFSTSISFTDSSDF